MRNIFLLALAELFPFMELFSDVKFNIFVSITYFSTKKTVMMG